MIFIKVCVLTLGCKVNSYESEVIKNNFLKNNYRITLLKENPDVIVINTCSVTNAADSKSRKLIRSAKKNNPKAVVVACGCMTQQHQEKLSALGIDILIGNKEKAELVSLVNDYLKDKKTVIKFNSQNNFDDMILDNYEARTRGFVKVQDGCHNFCSYCIIPYLRNELYSKDLDLAVKEITALVNKGFKEIVLTGIHTGSYGAGKDYNLVSLIKKISQLEKLKRIRISSIEITEIDNEFLEELANNDKICDHLHIPLQSGSDKVLKEMKRRYNINQYLKIIKQIRKIRPLINITTDIIVGFPAETKEDFILTMENATKVGFGKIHVFPYSKRDGTKAAKMVNIVSDIEKKSRVKTLINLSEELEIKYAQQFLNQKLLVLIENSNNGKSFGHTSNYLKLTINKELKANQEVLVLVQETRKGIITGIDC